MRLVIIVASFCCRTVQACSCGSVSPCARVTPDAVIFVGVPQNSTYRIEGDAYSGRRVLFKVDSIFHGLRAGTRLVDVDTLASSSCEALFDVGRPYLVYARHAARGSLAETLARTVSWALHGEPWGDESLQASQCSGSLPVADAGDDLDFLKAWLRKETVAAIQGEVYPDTNTLDAPDYNRRSRQLRGSDITAIDGNGQAWTVASDLNGHFRIPLKRGGRFVVSISTPRYRSAEPEYRVDVPERGCAEIAFWMGLDGQVRGLVREDGGGMTQPVKLELISVAEDDRSPTPLETTSQRNGEFAFTRVPPGRYVLGLNHSREPTAKMPYRRVYFPASEAPELARPIVLREAQTVSGIQLDIGIKMKPRAITARVSWPDGSPARFVHAWCAPTGYVPRAHDLTNEDGQITFPAMDGLSYDVGSAAASNYEIPARRRFAAKRVRVPPGDSVAIKLVLDHRPTK